MDNCSKHKKEVCGVSDMKVLAEAIGDLHYETLAELLDKLADKLFLDAAKDRSNDRKQLANVIESAAIQIDSASVDIESAWQISKPFMKQ